MTGGAAITASAARYATRQLKSKAKQGGAAQAWQAQAWDFYTAVPEVRFAAQWTAGAMSGATLFAALRNEAGEIERLPASHRASQIVAEIAGGPDGHAKLLKAVGPQLVVAGDYWTVVRPRTAKEDGGRVVGHDWHIVSVKKMAQKAGAMVATIGGEEILIPPYDEDAAPDPLAPVAWRTWEPHPADDMEADSSVRSSIGLLDELRLLNAAVKAIARSRLLGRGVLFVPKGTRFPANPGQSDAEDDLIEVFMQVAETAYMEPESAAAGVPIILEVPAEFIAAAKHLKFESEFDELAIRLREEAIRRFATGLEMPAEILLGLGDVNHWGQWALTQEAIRLGIGRSAWRPCRSEKDRRSEGLGGTLTGRAASARFRSCRAARPGPERVAPLSLR
ncbi:hypothetical protein ABZ572_03555 [Streptomyces sp. NPDC018338]|uniref:hypothetical protein n=1 Tax=Streptomyces sp. NPDC018338 TaxID=3157192 RepID=UPI0033EBA346